MSFLVRICLIIIGIIRLAEVVIVVEEVILAEDIQVDVE